MSEIEEVVTEVATTTIQLSKLRLGMAVGWGIGTGVAIGYYVAQRRLALKYSQIAAKEIDEAREAFAEVMKKREDDLSKLRAHVHELENGPKPELEGVMERLGYRAPQAVPIIETIPSIISDEITVMKKGSDNEVVKERDPNEGLRNVFDHPSLAEESGEEWDYAKEVKSRKPDVPYIIHVDEFEAGERGFDQTSLTFYEDDDVLSDSDDAVISHDVVGMQNLTRFGHGSGNEDLVYVRNDELEVDYEITRSTGSYAQEVHGFKHEDTTRRRRPDWNG